MLRPKHILKPQHLSYWRRHPDLNRGIKVLQTSALPLGYGAIFELIQTTKDARSWRLLSCCNGAEDEIRTRDVHLGKVTLYH